MKLTKGQISMFNRMVRNAGIEYTIELVRSSKGAKDEKLMYSLLRNDKTIRKDYPEYLI